MANMSNHVTVKVDGTERFFRALKEMRDAMEKCARALETLARLELSRDEKRPEDVQ